MKRRRFLRQSAAALVATSIPGWLHAQAVRDSGISAPATEAAYDTLRYPGPGQMRPGQPVPTLEFPGPAITLAVGGDTTLAYNLQNHFDEQVALGRTKEELLPTYFAGIRPIMDAADLAVVNLECALTERGKKLSKNFNFRGRPELVGILNHGSVDVVSCANNHARDYGDTGIKDTIKTLDHAGIAHFGSGKNLKDARKPVILERNGMKIGFLGYYFQIGEDMFEPPEVYATSRRAGPAGVFTNRDTFRAMVEEDVQALVPTVDFAVPYFHWGKEGTTEIRPYQIDLAHRCIDLGCKAVLGAHPHRLQGVEVYQGAPIFYSLGNFVYGGIKEPKDPLSAIARLRFTKAGVTADLVPIQITRWPDAPFQPFILQDAAREDALREIARRSASLLAVLPQLQPYLADQQLVPDR
jgi:poly-gamma-glutamate synthesis protein (capsule biosynthesis protein)